ncbi:integrase, catalytic region, zinc finger, CCHC-type containing protein [Tanacetum coccineum]|uniref:Integrase, catalytic region, zinc finger, CCHC-type containing protein n=1 Tax=Tanacetum coccineum TaxID=301880 RepID=A0ABQ5AC40_9ASTR
MTGDRSLLRNFIEKFMGTVRFGNDNFAAITGYGDYIHGNITICHVYYVEGDDLLTGGRDSNLYTIFISDMAASSPVCLMSKATSTKSWLWHRRLSHLNFGTINDLTRLDLVDGLPKFKYGKDHLFFRIYNRRTKMIMETIYVKFDELTTMASEHDYLEPKLQRFNNHNSSAEPMNTPSKEDLDNLFGLMFKEYYEQKSSDTPIYSAAQPTQVHEDSPSTSSIIVDTHEAPLVVFTSDEQTSLFSLTEVAEFNQEDTADFDGNVQFVPYTPPSHEEIESSTTALEPLNVQNFHQVQPSTHI